MLSTVPALGQQTCGDCDLFGIFSLLLSVDPIIAVNLVVAADQACLNNAVYWVRAKMYCAIRLQLLFLLAASTEAESDDEAYERKRTAQAALNSIDDCAFNAWVIAPTIEEAQEDPKPAPVIAPPEATCTCKIRVRVGDKMKSFRGRHYNFVGQIIDLEAECDPPGGSYSWSVDPLDRSGIRSADEKAQFIAERRGTFKVTLTYTGSDNSECTVEQQIVVQ
jgi:hypothetical protein